MIKLLWLISFIESVAALALYNLGRKHFVVAVVAGILAVLAWGGYVALIILLFGGPFYL